MAEKVKIMLDENHEVVSVEVNVDGKWESAEFAKAEGGGQAMTEGACGEPFENCVAKPGLCAYKIFDTCIWLPC